MQTVKEPQINADERRFVKFIAHESRLNELNPFHNSYSKKWSEISL